MRKTPFLLAGLAAFHATAALAGPSDGPTARLAELVQVGDVNAYVASRDALVGDASVDDAALRVAMLDQSQPQAAFHARVVLAWRADAEAAEAVWSLEPNTTRKPGMMRFTDPLAGEALLAPVVIERLWHGDEDTTRRVALVDAARRSEGDWAAGLAWLFPHEQDPDVRSVIVEAMRRAPTSEAHRVLSLAAADEAPIVVAAMLRTAPYVEDAGRYVGVAERYFGSSDADLRRAAARAAGLLDEQPTWNGLVAMLGDGHEQVRLEALRALDRLDPDRAATTPQVAALVNDPSLVVSRRAARMIAPR